MTSVVKIEGQQLPVNDFQDLSLKDKSEMRCEAEILQVGSENHGGICAICLDKIVLQETALVKGCEHAYCVTCILQWATHCPRATCPQCKHPFEFLNVHRSLDGGLHDYMFEESVCLLLRASWFKPLNVEDRAEHEDIYMYDDIEDYFEYDDGQDDLDEAYYGGSSSIRIGNRRWGDNGYVRAGRQQARPVYQPHSQNSGASSSREPRNKEVVKGATTTGRRAKRALKREEADKAAAAKHQQHLVRLGRK
ncbi:uncharacterized protein LOC129319050 [Prosopis cineraria]|uniref:uncharacterized protein LOC129319050 n=1 Tax=Prosopis cineraria TaxID=364024 RepID=UPI002410A26A|nr:uncharacterized protein LOC129319050 [Prosopis cineraria]